jgi:iron-sulfur cluster assembly protein
MDYADCIEPDELVFEQHGSKLVVRPEHLPVLEGMILDFQKQGLNEAFKFLNPNVKAQCGCGESFAV